MIKIEYTPNNFLKTTGSPKKNRTGKKKKNKNPYPNNRFSRKKVVNSKVIYIHLIFENNKNNKNRNRQINHTKNCLKD